MFHAPAGFVFNATGEIVTGRRPESTDHIDPIDIDKWSGDKIAGDLAIVKREHRPHQVPQRSSRSYSEDEDRETENFTNLFPVHAMIISNNPEK